MADDIKKTGKNSGKVTFTTGQDKEVSYNTSEMAGQIRHLLKVNQQSEDLLKKSVTPKTVRKDLQKKYDQNKVVFSAKSYEKSHDNVETKSWKRLTDLELKEVSQVDPYISAIISTRCSQASVIARPSESKFDKGTRILDLDPPQLQDFENKEEFAKARDIREQQSKTIAEWVWNCGTEDKDVIDTVFSDPASSKMLKYCNLADYMACQVRNLLAFGRSANQIFRNEDGLPVMWRPMPVETIYPAYENRDIHLGEARETMQQSKEDARDYNELDPEERPDAWVQRVEGRNVNFYTEDEIKINYFQKQAWFDLGEYPLSPIEMAIYMVFIHQNTLGYLRNQFVKGLGTKGILALEANDASSELSPEDMEELRREFHNFLSRTDNSAVTPVISGPVKVNWIPLSANPRDMEFLQVEEHVIRSLCASMQTSPQEMGYGHLSINQGSLSGGGSKQEEIIQGEERGLRMLLDIIYDELNEILYENFPEAKDNFKISYTGVGEDTRDAVITRDIQELQTTATMSSLWANSEKKDPIPDGADVPLSEAFHANVARYMFYGDFMEKFFGREGWSQKPEFNFIMDPNLEAARQQAMMFDSNMLKAQGEIQLKTQAEELESLTAQTEMADSQNQAMEQQMQMGGDPSMGQPGEEEPQEGQPQEGQPQEGQPQEDPQGDQPPQEGAPEEVEKSVNMKEEYYRRMKNGDLQKSLKGYFGEWMHAHYTEDSDNADDTPVEPTSETED